MGLVLIGVGASGALAVTGHGSRGAGHGGALFQMVNHAAFKGCLFLGAGRSSERPAPATSTSRAAGRLPATARCSRGALSICALPPFSGFASEWLLLQGLLRGFSAHGAATATALLAGVAALALTGGLTAAAFVKAFGIGFLGQPRTPEAAAAGEAAPAMLAGMALLAVPCLVLGVVPGAVVPLLARAAGTALGGPPPDPLHAGTGLGHRRQRRRDPAGAAGRGAAGGLVLAWALVRPPARRAGARRAEAWGCGRELQTARMQYTATSFAEPLQRVFADVLRPDLDLDVSHLAESRYFEQAHQLPQPDRRRGRARLRTGR